MEEIDSHMKLRKSWTDSPESSDFSKTVSLGFPEEQVGTPRGSGVLPPQIFQGYSIGISWMDPPYVLIIGDGGTSSDAGADEFGIGQLGEGFTLGSAQGSSARDWGICVGASFSSVESCQLGKSLKVRSWLN